MLPSGSLCDLKHGYNLNMEHAWMTEVGSLPAVSWRKRLLDLWTSSVAQREGRILLILSILIGALTGLAVVAFILLTERLGMRLYPVGSSAWHRVLIPIAGSLFMGYLVVSLFSGRAWKRRAADQGGAFARDGVISLGTIIGKFFCTSATLASGIPLGREGPSVQVGAGIASVLGRQSGIETRVCKSAYSSWIGSGDRCCV